MLFRSGLLCLLYDDSGYRVRSLKLPGGTEILYFESRPPVPAWGEAPGWRTVSSPHEAPGRPGVLYIPLRPDGPAWRHRGGRGVRFEDNTRLFLPAPRFANSQRTWVTGVATSVSRTVPASEGRDSEVR